MTRVNFLAEKMRVREQGTLSPDEFVDLALDLMGPLEDMDPQTRQELVDKAHKEANTSTRRVVEMLQLVVGTLQYQLA